MRLYLASFILLASLNIVCAQCSDTTACNYNPNNTDTGTTEACVTIESHVVHDSGDLAGMTTYRVYVNLSEPDQFLSAISTIMTGCTESTACNYSPSASLDDGSCEYSSCPPGAPVANVDATPSQIRITSTTTFYQDPFGSHTATAIMSSLIPVFPSLEYDSWITIGHAPEDGAPAATVSAIASPSQNWPANFEAGNDLIMDDLIGGLWYIFNDGNDQGLPDEDGKVLIAQLTTDGTVGVQISGQYFPDFGTGINGEADGTSAQLFISELGPNCPGSSDSGCEYPESGLDCDGNCLNDTDADGVCDENDPCIGTYDACNVCNGPGEVYTCGCTEVPAGDCDCNGNQLDALNVCGGACMADSDNDGICDDVDPCVGTLDACGMCNGPGAIYDCGCSDFPNGDCDCNGNQTDALGVCGGACAADDDNDGVCDDIDPCVGSYDALGICNGNCVEDADDDNVCDDVDPCVGDYDALGICNGDCPSDVDGDNICDNEEVPGCTNENACNYDDAATDDDGSCASFDAIGTCGGSCTADIDEDGVCDDIDPCIGEYDACGVCNGPGATYECGCSGIPDGDCDCDGNVADIIGNCGGLCAEDADNDGICDDVDNCIGTFDDCGVCNGYGQIYQCGCANIPPGDCDCDGNQLDAIGVCGGSCEADENGNGICDALEALLETEGCTDSTACNYASCATTDDGSCSYTDALGVCGGDCTADTDSDGVCDSDEIEGCANPFACNYNPAATDDDGSCLTDDVLGECGGSCSADADGDGICDDVDTCVGTLDACNVCNGPGEVYDCGCTSIPTGDCDCNGNQTDALGICGGDCTADTDSDGVCDSDEIEGCANPFACNYNPAATDDDGSCLTDDVLGECGGTCSADADGDGICDDVDTCVGTLDACNVCNGPGEIYDCGCTSIPLGDCDCDGNQTDALGVCGGDCTADTDSDGVCDSNEIEGCANPFACNYNPAATDDDGSCLTDDVLGECGGSCSADADGDGICDDVDTCVGTLDACNVCNGPGEIYDCGCTSIPLGDCDCDGNQTDALGVCGGDCTADTDSDGVCDSDEIEGCANPFACNYNPAATDDDGSCLTDDVLGECGGSCSADADGDGICDDVDTCVGTLDACNVCNGPGEIYDCGCTSIPPGDCDCNGNQTDALGVCGGDCTADTDSDGVCDSDEIEGCANPFACNYNPAATDDDGSCLTDDVLGECGGSCSADADADGICDDVDTCVGTLDACNVCNGPGEVYDCGCTSIPPGDCDCNGNQTDALGLCGGDCITDDNGNGICDNTEVSGCTYVSAENYNLLATWDDGTCSFGSNCPEGACFFDFNGDGGVGATDLLDFLVFFGDSCD